MAIQTVNTIKQWFMTGKYPVQQQFWDWLDSFFHKTDIIPLGQVAELADDLNAKQEAISNIIVQLNDLYSLIQNDIQVPQPLDCSANPDYPVATAGQSWKVTAAGLIGGSSGEPVQVGDMIICTTENAGGNQITAGTHFYILQANLDLATQNVPGIVKLATQSDITNKTPGVAVTPDLLPPAPPPPTLLQVLGAGNTSTPNTPTKPIMQFDDSGQALSNPVEGAFEITKGTDGNNPNLKGGVTFTTYDPFYGVSKRRLVQSPLIFHRIARHSQAYGIWMLLDTANVTGTEVGIEIKPYIMTYGFSGTATIDISFDGQASWTNIWTLNVPSSLANVLVSSEFIRFQRDEYWNFWGGIQLINDYAADGTITTTKKAVGGSSNQGNVYVRLTGTNIGLDYVVYQDMGWQW